MSTWISDNKDPKAKDAWMDAFRKKVMAASMEMRTIRDLTDLAKWEGSIRGKWASHEYIHLVEVQIEMIASMVQVRGVTGSMTCSSIYPYTAWRRPDAS